MILHVLREVDLLRLVVWLDLDDSATGAVVRRDEHAVRVHDRRRDVRHVVRRLLVFPQQLSITNVETDSPLRSKEHDLRPAIYFQRYRRRITRLVALALPDHRTVSLIQRHHRSARPARVHEHLVSEYERRLADAPLD